MKTKRVSIPELDAEENLRADNELTALSLETQYNAHTFIADDAPPELVQQFLERVTAFEKDWKEEKTITVYEKIGSPEFPEPDVLEASTLPDELERIMDLLKAQCFMVFRPEELPDEDFYRFIVEDVFPSETPLNPYPGMIHCLDYRDFYPDKQSLIAASTEIFLLALLNLQAPFPDEALSEECRNERFVIPKEEALAVVEGFRSRYDSIIPVAFKLDQFIERYNGTWQTFGIRWEGTPAGGAEAERFEGLGVMQLVFEEQQWKVQGLMMPGFCF